MVGISLCVKGDCAWQHSYVNNWHLWHIVLWITFGKRYTNSQVKDQNPREFELIFALVMLISLGVLIYEAISILFNKPLDFHR